MTLMITDGNGHVRPVYFAIISSHEESLLRNVLIKFADERGQCRKIEIPSTVQGLSVSRNQILEHSNLRKIYSIKKSQRIRLGVRREQNIFAARNSKGSQRVNSWFNLIATGMPLSFCGCHIFIGFIFSWE